jgi:hypothetical protein
MVLTAGLRLLPLCQVCSAPHDDALSRLATRTRTGDALDVVSLLLDYMSMKNGNPGGIAAPAAVQLLLRTS